MESTKNEYDLDKKIRRVLGFVQRLMTEGYPSRLLLCHKIFQKWGSENFY